MTNLTTDLTQIAQVCLRCTPSDHIIHLPSSSVFSQVKTWEDLRRLVAAKFQQLRHSPVVRLHEEEMMIRVQFRLDVPVPSTFEWDNGKRALDDLIRNNRDRLKRDIPFQLAIAMMAAKVTPFDEMVRSVFRRISDQPRVLYDIETTLDSRLSKKR